MTPLQKTYVRSMRVMGLSLIAMIMMMALMAGYGDPIATEVLSTIK